MNQDGIEHVSYTIMDLRISPSGKYLLAATDTSRHLIFGVCICSHTRDCILFIHLVLISVCVCAMLCDLAKD